MWQVLTNFDPALLLAFIGAGLLLNITPGADFLFVSASGIQGGPKIGAAAALGVNIGVWVHVILAALGVSAVLLAYPAAYHAIRYAGAGYLVYLAVQTWRDSGDIATRRAALSVGAAVCRGFVTNVLNPKTALFIFAFIPQFTDPDIGPVWMQILILGAIFQAFGMAFSLCLGLAAGAFSNALEARVRTLNKITAIVFGGLATRLVID
jgi:threonine/homoserine/homoserine lactone efflux protein